MVKGGDFSHKTLITANRITASITTANRITANNITANNITANNITANNIKHGATIMRMAEHSSTMEP
ncbi:unnamed protein product [Clonostachys chloroleuca]|uniref:Uncharacterized protein n=1 Tax=Clonostachys chloroleuca TaxID=1926264 RepID=A0AA35QBQ3_9HYPO|nr:unnamed protein product [Clonostachys chloroleuca]